jgi:hypothetical protein
MHTRGRFMNETNEMCVDELLSRINSSPALRKSASQKFKKILEEKELKFLETSRKRAPDGKFFARSYNL